MKGFTRTGARAAGVACALALMAGIGGAVHGSSAARSDTADDWPMFHHDITHTGTSAETTIGASNVPTLGVVWEADTGGTIFSSPAVVYNAALGERVVYVGNKTGVSAYDASTGQRLWFHRAGNVHSSPAVVNGVVYFGSGNHYLYALDATTGKLDCRFLSEGTIASSPVVVDPNGTGPVVYFGDNGLTGSDDGGNVWAINAVDSNPAPDCGLVWQFNSFVGSLTGVWSPPAFAHDKNGQPLLVFGTGDPDDSIVAVNAVTGVQQWVYDAPVGNDTDIGAGPTISAPGVNGFGDGAVYVGSKYGVMLALDLTTGAAYWVDDLRADGPSNPTGFRSTASLVGNRVYVGSSTGMYALDAVTGAKIWLDAPMPITASPAITGGPGDQTVIVGDMSGTIRALSAADGSQLWSNATGASYIFSSAAISNGTVYVGTPKGLLIAYGLGGTTGDSPPNTTVTSPAASSTVPNPNGSLVTSGAATDDLGVTQVMVAVRDASIGKWWDAGTQSWTSVYQEQPATLGSPGGTSTTWSFSFPVPFVGGQITVQADAIDTSNQRDPIAASDHFFIPSLGNPPDTTISAPTHRQVFNFPLNADGTTNYTPFPINITGTATDSGGAHPGIAAVYVIVKNIQHQEYYCGPSGCPGEPGVYWAEHSVHFLANLDSPGATSTSWSASFPVYDHPHTYSITAVAVDNDGEKDTSKASATPVCVNDPGIFTCK